MEDSGSSLLLAHAAEVRAPTVERAAHLLDAALAHRHTDDQGRHAHLVFTLNIYQYSVDTSAKGGGKVERRVGEWMSRMRMSHE